MDVISRVVEHMITEKYFDPSYKESMYEYSMIYYVIPIKDMKIQSCSMPSSEGHLDNLPE